MRAGKMWMMMAGVLASVYVRADVSVPAILGSHMVLQQGQTVPVWGWADPGEEVTVSFAGQELRTQTDDQGNWRVNLAALDASAEPRTLTVSGKNTVQLEDVLVGEVWLCSGQSNMGMNVNGCWNADLEIATANYPLIRLVTINNQGSQEPQKTFQGGWETCSPQTVGNFSAVGYFFGRTLHQMLGVPVGLIDNAWGGSACEAWVRRDLLEGKELYAPLMERWATTEATYNHDEKLAEYKEKLAEWEVKNKEAQDAGKTPPQRPRSPNNPLTAQHRPANLYQGRIIPLVPFAIKGAIWYQGESNAGRAYQYRDLFPLMIENWRDTWGEGDFPFYWVQLADFQDEPTGPQESSWAELREAQTMALSRVPHSGQAVITDLGEASDIHPKSKQNVGFRLARWALVQDYGLNLAYRSPEFSGMTIEGNKALVSFEHVRDRLRAVDHRDIRGFAIAGDDRNWVWAKADLVGKNQVRVWSDEVAEPVAVRFAWATNPIANLYEASGLPVTPFRTDDWPGVTAEER